MSWLGIAGVPLLAAVSREQEWTLLSHDTAALGILVRGKGDAIGGCSQKVLVAGQEDAALAYRLTLLTGYSRAMTAFWFVPRLTLAVSVAGHFRLGVREYRDHSWVG